MKVLSFAKLNLEKLEVGQVETDDLGNKTCQLNSGKLLFKACELKLKLVDGNYFIDSPSESLLSFFKSFEQQLITLLHENSNEIFGKEFNIEKFQNGMVSFVTDSGVLLTVNCNSKFLNVLGDELVFENTNTVNGNFILNLESITFIKTKFYVNLTVKLFQELEESEEVKQDTDTETETEKVLEENFF